VAEVRLDSAAIKRHKDQYGFAGDFVSQWLAGLAWEAERASIEARVVATLRRVEKLPRNTLRMRNFLIASCGVPKHCVSEFETRAWKVLRERRCMEH
jgi:hypothetical protein